MGREGVGELRMRFWRIEVGILIDWFDAGSSGRGVRESSIVELASEKMESRVELYLLLYSRMYNLVCSLRACSLVRVEWRCGFRIQLVVYRVLVVGNLMSMIDCSYLQEYHLSHFTFWELCTSTPV